MFPIIEGLAVALTDHVARNRDRQQRRGKLAQIHRAKRAATEGSVWENDVRILHELPDVVYVKFEKCTWQIEGAPGPGIYPVTKVKRYWYLDKGRRYPQLAIQREQVPLVCYIPFFKGILHIYTNMKSTTDSTKPRLRQSESRDSNTHLHIYI